jgi:GT2 family glycosyltransferase
MKTLAPPVVAVVVAHDPGPWFEETLASLGSQDYAELSVLVLDNAGTDDLTARVAAVLPTAFVRRFEVAQGYGAVTDEVRTMVDGAAFYLFCHDDIALSPDAVHLLVEESFRSNAGIVSPKVVGWDDPDHLLHVGMGVDKGGSVVDRVQAAEIDHGQHDAVRDVFVAPGGCTLVRSDLFEALDGFDPAIVAMGEDLDLCWRALVAGARVVVAPAARVRHRQELAGRARPPDPLLGSADERAGDGVPTIQELQRRHELLVVLKCYERFHRLRVVPQIAVLGVAEYVVAMVAGNRVRASAVAHAWRWNLARLSTTRRLRKQVQATRRISDRQIRELQLAGSTRLSSYLRRVFQHGFHGAHADELQSAQDLEAASAAGAPVAAGPGRGGMSARARLGVWVAAIAVVLFGSRQLVVGVVPSIGQFVPFPSWGATFSQFASGWHPSGVGSTAPATPAFAVAGLVGTVLLGAMGLTQKVLLLSCIPFGAWGAVRLIRPFGSQRASLVTGIVYLAIPLPYDALALGRLDALAVYAAAPWVLGHLFRFTGIPPYAPAVDAAPGAAGGHRHGRSRYRTIDSEDGGPTRHQGRRPTPRGRRWLSAHRTFRAVLLLGVLEALAVSFVPSAALVVLLAGVAVALSAVIVGGLVQAVRALWLAIGSTLVAGVLCLPWLIGVVSAGGGARSVLGTPSGSTGVASWGTLLRFSIGPIGGSPLTWAFVSAALLPLLLGHGTRFQWAGRCWAVAVVFWTAAWMVGHGWTGGIVVDQMVLLGPAAAVVAMAIGLGIAAFEEDLRAADFGWRQVAAAAAAVAVAAGMIPTLVSAGPGRWDTPPNVFAQSLAWMHARSSAGAFRVLWLGDPRSLNQGSWGAGSGLAYATSEGGSPDATLLWNAASPGPADQLAWAVDQARMGRTDRLGAMLAPAGVRYVVVVTAIAPVIPQVQSPAQYPLPSDLAPALQRQLDLAPMLTETGITVYANTDWIPVRASVGGASTAALAAPAHPPGAAW